MQLSLRRLLIPIVVVLFAAGVFAVLAANNRWTGTGSRTAQATPTAAQLTPGRAPGVGGPQLPTTTPTHTHLPGEQGSAAYSPTAASTATLTATSTATPTQTPTRTATPTPLPPALQALTTLQNSTVPARDMYSLAERLLLKDGSTVPRTSSHKPGTYKAGRRDLFNISNIETHSYYTVTATLRRVTSHVYWYVQDGGTYDPAALQQLSDVFESTIYPTNRTVFGSEWSPGVDNDPRITVLFAPLHGMGGSYSAADEYTRAVNPFSNEREIIYISTTNGWAGLESTLAHEFQHMIHWHEHPNQDVWLNEGASMLASSLYGYDIQGVDTEFMRKPDVQLNSWKPNPELALANYGASFLFLEYLRVQYGDKVIREAVKAPTSGIGAIDYALSSLGSKDRFKDVFGKWIVANIADGQPGAARWMTYPNRRVQVSPQALLNAYPATEGGSAPQFGARYIRLAPPQGDGKLRVAFTGEPEVPLVQARAHSGKSLWWSNRGELADTSMTRHLDLTGVRSATLNYYTWFDIEPDFDYAYAEVSTDGGATWSTLKGQYTSPGNSNGTNYGNAFTGSSASKTGADKDGWLSEHMDLTPYAGKNVLLRFEYVTDDSYSAQGFAVDDITVPEIGYSDDAEGDTGWEMKGFARVPDRLPQGYLLYVLRQGDAGLDLMPVKVDAGGRAEFDVEGLGISGPYTSATLIIAGTTPHTLQRAPYRLLVTEVP